MAKPYIAHPSGAWGVRGVKSVVTPRVPLHHTTPPPHGKGCLSCRGHQNFFFKEAGKILNPSDACFKGADSKKLGCLNLRICPPTGEGERGSVSFGMSHYCILFLLSQHLSTKKKFCLFH